MSAQYPLERLATLSEIHEMLPDSIDITLDKLHRLAEPNRKSGFPPVRDGVGRFNFYDKEEVIRWVTMYARATRNWNGRKANGKRTNR